MRQHPKRWFAAALGVMLGTRLLLAAEPAPPVGPPVAPPAKPEKFYWKESGAEAKVVSATFIGGPGHEWLVSGGWQPDGSVILVGNVLGPVFDLGAPVQVIGMDAPPPPATEPPKIELGDRARPTVIWDQPGATGFLVKCAPDLQKVTSVHRLPWASGVITAAAVDPAGAVYLAGLATEAIEKLGGEQQKAAADTKVAGGPPNPTAALAREAFLAKVAPDLRHCEWVRRVQGLTSAPQLRRLADGRLWFAAQDVRAFDAAGNVLSVLPVTGEIGPRCAVSPVDGLVARNTSRGNWSTSREPWKCPGVRITQPDGSNLYHLYEWDGRYVGLDNHRSVADTTVMNLAYDYGGNLLLYTWSDGGNTVMRYGSQDIRRSHGCRGLPLHWGGTGYNIVKLEGRDYHTVASTKWQSEHQRGVRIMRMSTLAPLSDGAVCVAGTGGDKGVHETVNSLLPDAGSHGNYVTVLGGDLVTVQFGTLTGGAGEVNVGAGAWGAVSGVVAGQTKYLLCTGAKEANELNVIVPTVNKTPTRHALQSVFGGGALDGYVILLDAAKPVAQAAKPAPVLPEKFSRLGVEALAVSKKRAFLAPAEGAVFHFSPAYPKFVTADAEFRDAADACVLYQESKDADPTAEVVTPDGLAVSVRAARPVIGPSEPLEFDLAFTNRGAQARQEPPRQWTPAFEGGWRCRFASGAALEPVPALALNPGQTAAVRIRLPRSGVAFAPVTEQGADGQAVAWLPLGVYRVAFALTPTGAAGALVTKPAEFRIWPYWPNFMYGRPVSGEMKWQGGRLTGRATVACPTWVQVVGDQRRRVLGELIQGKQPDAFPAVTFTLSDLGETKTDELKSVDAQGKPLVKYVTYAEGKGRLEFNGCAVDVNAKCTLNFSTTMPDNGKPGVGIECFFTVRGRDLGLTRLTEEEVDVRIGLRGTLTLADAPATPPSPKATP